MINIDKYRLVGKGHHREVYRHPQNPDLCIKIIVDGNFDSRQVRREKAYYRHLEKKGISWDMVPKYHGDIITDLGTGSVFDLILDQDGSVSKTLENYLASNEVTEANYHGLSKSLNSIESNLGLFAYKQVKAIDTIISRFLIEFNIFSLNLILFTLLFFILEIGNIPEKIYTLTLGMFLLSIFTFGFSLLVGALNRLNQVVANVISVSTRILFYLSGIFFTVNIIPSQYHEYVLYNPIIHFLELFRYSFFDTYNYQYYNIEYMTTWSLIVLLLGLSFNYFNKDKLKSIF